MSPISSLPTREVAGITIPDTPLVSKAIAYVRDQVDDFTYNHVMRSFLFAITSVPIVTASAPDYPIDYEVIAISTLLHDLAWATSSDKCTPDKRFEVDSANAAREFLVKETGNDASWLSHRVQVVWDAIALHTTNSIAMHKQPEVMLAHVGVSADFMGPNIFPGGNGPLTSEIFNEVVSVFPRKNFKEGVREIMCDLCKAKPQTTYDNFVGEFGEKYVEGYDRTGKKVIDLLETAI
ncbi:uncharacterized protein N7484_011899 [Penicillium longicatenatum]|uniref:uncharacterized protein n=1 Tax=Penicillium longicatenatum TaxID=1561947 RepID=UPI0025499350|nr:uncharacterized protein N7484_011899 [Penicillium longicatenatum]KAJ5631799.1 hypothetical protein N7484_011899 [Penicillium longicatenatum]